MFEIEEEWETCTDRGEECRYRAGQKGQEIESGEVGMKGGSHGMLTTYELELVREMLG